MFGTIFDDLRSAIDTGSDFWDAALQLAGPTASEIVSSKKSEAAPGTSAVEKYNELTSLSNSYSTGLNVSERSKSYKTEAASAVDAAAIREAYIRMCMQYAAGGTE